jgi:hypothetical protein
MCEDSGTHVEVESVASIRVPEKPTKFLYQVLAVRTRQAPGTNRLERNLLALVLLRYGGILTVTRPAESSAPPVAPLDGAWPEDVGLEGLNGNS